jgi:S1-C subfamily serine protease
VLGVSTARVPDAYGGGGADREVYSLAAAVRPGNSGGPLLTTGGRVAGVVFARADSEADIGYAMSNAELRPVADRAARLDTTVSSGRCAS